MRPLTIVVLGLSWGALTVALVSCGDDKPEFKRAISGKLEDQEERIAALEARLVEVERTVERLAQTRAWPADRGDSPAQQQLVESMPAEIWRVGNAFKALVLEEGQYLAHLSVARASREVALELRDNALLDSGNTVQVLVHEGVPKIGLYSNKVGITAYIKDQKPVLQFRDERGVTRLQIGILNGAPAISFHDASGVAVQVLAP